MDFFGGSGEPYDSLFRIRTAGIEINWENTSVMFGQDKPLIAPREPNSLAQVGLSPLTGAGNLWLWQPQMRVEQRFHLDARTSFRAQVGVFQTREDYGYVPPTYFSTLQGQRPALQGRFSLAHNLDDERRIEVGAGFDASTTHVAGATVPSRVFAFDWFANPWRRLEFSGTFFRGRNLTGLGGIGQGFTIVTGSALIALVLILVNYPCISLWALFGTAIGRFLTSAFRRRIFNGILALALAVTGIGMLVY